MTNFKVKENVAIQWIFFFLLKWQQFSFHQHYCLHMKTGLVLVSCADILSNLYLIIRGSRTTVSHGQCSLVPSVISERKRPVIATPRTENIGKCSGVR